VRLFTTFKEASDNCFVQGNHAPYEEEDIAKMTLFKTKAFIKGLETANPAYYNKSNTVILLAISAASSNNCIHVIDLGGAGGIYYFLFKRMFGNRYTLRWHVVETPTMVSHVRELENEELKYFTSLESASDGMEINILLSSGVLQYLSEPYLMLEKMIALMPQHMLFIRISLAKGDMDLITIQKSMLNDHGAPGLPEGMENREISLPYINVSENKFLKTLSGKYRPLAKFEDSDPFFAGKLPVVGYGLLLKREGL
jgi:putative methyltransferase (TIGR04325 family)